MSLRIAIAKPDWGITGGFELVVNEFASRLHAQGHRVDWLQPQVSAMAPRAYGFDVSELQDVAPDFTRYIQLIELFSSLETRRADLVVSAMPGAYAVQHPRHLALFSHHLRRYYDLSDVIIEAGLTSSVEAHHHASRHVRRIDNLYLGAAPLILAASDEVAARLRHYNHLTHNVDVYFAGLGFNGRFPEQRHDDAFEHVLCVSRHEFPKRTELFVHAAAHLRNANTIAVGAGGRLGWAKHLAAEFRGARRDPDAPSRPLWGLDSPWLDPTTIEVRGQPQFAGYVTADELERLYRRALCVVAPAYLEDYGLTAIEAMAYGKPLIVCSDGGNLVNFVDDGVNGFVVEPEGTAIAEAVQRFVDDPALAQKLGAAARETARPYTWDRAMRQFQAGIDRVMAR